MNEIMPFWIKMMMTMIVMCFVFLLASVPCIGNRRLKLLQLGFMSMATVISLAAIGCALIWMWTAL